ncbi:MAG: acyl-CoA thioesterase [Bdellovibrio sp.]|nr:acyl-CoA thioesterase [Bdellovibrio sp.]
MFKYTRRIHVYETDLMGIVHHSNYLRICEEARVAWCIKNGFMDTSHGAVFSLTVLETRVKHLKPARYGDEVTVSLQVKTKGARLIFQYLIHAHDLTLSKAETIHCSLDTDMKVKRLDQNLVKILEKEKWTETWL